ncbi:acyl-CoA dehydrogenase [Thermomicrobium sp. 4228-Ro]|uniref:acyl-CoA dehydrogenase n=1 Tax=Thermomicrobium sp. 4228-Ro TaxID=2993937 RepID=UPI0022489ADC|nr:acyl-CoA dehydrogenase [Thermomicrobium sp. 4228-Ro]MCX2728244.1 acyl-CoA dehydrogenase [Thermomicrobium sp. 4228-Ro]
MVGTLARHLIDPTLQERLAPVLEERAPRVDAGDVPAQSSIDLLVAEGLLPAVDHTAPVVPAPVELVQAGELLATVAWFDLASAFSLWCHVVTLVYLAFSEPGSPLREGVLPELISARRYGSTALATALGHVQTGRPLPVTARQRNGALTLDGFVPWASNLTGRFLVVTPAQAAHGTLVVAVPGEAAGVTVEPYPRLLALQATASSSLRFASVDLPVTWVLARDVRAFLRVVQPAFLALQASFCWGLAARALSEAHAALRGVNEVFRKELEAAWREAERLAGALRESLATALQPVDEIQRRAVLELRLAAMRLACSAVALEAKVKGGQAYRAESPTARRQREAAFLPIQTPTEGQLLWELQLLNSSA